MGNIVAMFEVAKPFWLLNAIIGVLIIALLILNCFIPQIRGWLGEKRVRKLLNELDDSLYAIENNLLLQADTKTVQIDHVVISNYGIFVIETKNYVGWVAGKDFDKTWTHINRGRFKTKMINPVKQNWGHIQALKGVLSSFPKVNFISVVVFNEGIKLKVSSKTDVIHIEELLQTVQKYNAETISEEERETIARQLKTLNLNNFVNKKKHIHNLKSGQAMSECSKTETIIEQKAQAEEQPTTKPILCSKCGVPMVRRTATRGSHAGQEFYGCPNYPRCREIISIPQNDSQAKAENFIH